jgi:hypothetical protein
MPAVCHQAGSLLTRWTSRWCTRQSGTVNSSLALRPWLRVAQVMWVGRLATADEAGLPGHVAQVLLATVAARLGDGECAGILSCQIRCRSQDMRTEVGKDLAEIHGKTAENVERKVSAEDQLKRVDILRRLMALCSSSPSIPSAA